jgi:ribosomal protein S27AE
VSESKAQRSKTTGHLLLVMPKVRPQTEPPSCGAAAAADHGGGRWRNGCCGYVMQVNPEENMISFRAVQRERAKENKVGNEETDDLVVHDDGDGAAVLMNRQSNTRAPSDRVRRKENTPLSLAEEMIRAGGVQDPVSKVRLRMGLNVTGLRSHHKSSISSGACEEEGDDGGCWSPWQAVNIHNIVRSKDRSRQPADIKTVAVTKAKDPLPEEDSSASAVYDGEEVPPLM